MKQKPILVWFISAILYLGVVIGGHSVYASMNPDNHQQDETSQYSGSSQDHSSSSDDKSDSEQHQAHVEEKENDEMENNGHETENSTHGTTTESEVNVKVDYQENVITVDLKDKEEKEPQLEVNHEKVMHLIVVSADLKDYYHLHPTDKGNGVFEQEYNLEDNSYKVFVDIKPKDLEYHVNPIELNVGEAHTAHGDNQLKVDTEFEKTINDKTVELNIDSLEINKPTTLTFKSKDGKPNPYLGALGHVVILDEEGEKFIHVHPASEDATVFETQFDKPGIYKLWGEFKFGEQVNAYSFVIEVK